MLQMKLDAEMLRYSNQHQLTIEQTRAMMAGKILDNRNKETLQARELAHAETSPSGQGI
jgi:hypothetical protein